MKRLIACTAVIVVALLLPGLAQDDGFDSLAVVLTYHKITGEPFDFERAAAQSDAAMRASGFDRPDVLKAQIAQLQQRMAASNPAAEFVISVNNSLEAYDHDQGEFSIGLFTPGHYVPVRVFHLEYRLVFANAERARRLPMPKDQAREFDARMNSMGRQLTSEIRFKVTGKGDPSGAVADGNVIRAEMVAVRVLDRNGNVVFTPDLTKVSAAEVNERAFDASKLDVAGLRLGVSASDLEATLKRLYGKVGRGKAAGNNWAKFTGSVEVNSNGCFSVYGRRNNPGPGTVCITASFDGNEVVRAIRIERFFPAFDPDLLRKALVKKYGPVSSTRGGALFGWGPDVEGAGRALSANFSEDRQLFDDGLNRIPNVKVTLQLVDPAWVAANRR